MVNEKRGVPSLPLKYYAYVEQSVTITSPTTQIYRTGTFSTGINWGNIFIVALYQNYTTTVPCAANVRPVDATTFYIHVRDVKGLTTNGLLRVMALVDRPVTITLS